MWRFAHKQEFRHFDTCALSILNGYLQLTIKSRFHITTEHVEETYLSGVAEGFVSWFVQLLLPVIYRSYLRNITTTESS